MVPALRQLPLPRRRAAPGAAVGDRGRGVRGPGGFDVDDAMSAKRGQLTHLDERGAARMVDVGDKPVTAREAVAEGYVSLQRATLAAIADAKVPKGEVLNTARVAG